MRILCAFGIHKKQRAAPFVRQCVCGAMWVADYFEWREDGYPTWWRIRPVSLAKAEAAALAQQSKGGAK